MQFTTKSQFLFLILALLSIISFVPVNALPISNIQVKRDVYVPPVLYPHSGTVWKVGQTYSVTWDNSNPPHQITNPIGQIYLRKGDRTESSMSQSVVSLDPFLNLFVRIQLLWLLVLSLPLGKLLSLFPKCLLGLTTASSVSTSSTSPHPKHFSLIHFSPVMGDSGDWSDAFTIDA